MVDAGAVLSRAWQAIDAWEERWGPAPAHPAMDVAPARLEAALEEWLSRLTAPPRGDTPGNYPFFHPRYAGQMLKPPHPVAVAAYAAALRINPNNHALDGGPPSGLMEREVMADLASMFGFASDSLGHLTGGGTVANLEALWVARESHPGKAIAFSADAHYTHSRMAGVLGLDTLEVPADDRGRMELGALEAALRAGQIGTVVLTAGTTGLGSVDEIATAIPLARAHGARVHVDAAYGGFFRLLAESGAPTGFPAEHFLAIRDADSIVVDPHKHGLQPYGCGAVLFRDPSVGRFYKHDSPYTYFTSRALHLGEISLECSRPGAAAAALWLTLRALPLMADDGLGPILAAGLRAARDLAARLEASDRLDVYASPELDIVVYAPRPDTPALTALDAASQRVFDAGMADEDDPVFLSLYRLDAGRLRRRFPAIAADAPAARVLRSVLMKPEHEAWMGWLAERLETL